MFTFYTKSGRHQVRCTLEYATWIVWKTPYWCGIYDGGTYLVYL